MMGLFERKRVKHIPTFKRNPAVNYSVYYHVRLVEFNLNLEYEISMRGAHYICLGHHAGTLPLPFESNHVQSRSWNNSFMNQASIFLYELQSDFSPTPRLKPVLLSNQQHQGDRCRQALGHGPVGA